MCPLGDVVLDENVKLTEKRHFCLLFTFLKIVIIITCILFLKIVIIIIIIIISL